MKNLIIILMLLVASCKSVKTTPYNYKIEYLESDTISYVDQVKNFEEFPEDAIVFKYINGRYIKIIQVYE